MSIATKTGDLGETGLLFGKRVSKTHPRIVANGAVDELNAALGLSRAFVTDPVIAASLFGIQKELVVLMGELALDPADAERFAEKGFGRITAAMVDTLTAQIDRLEKGEKISFKHWATPGATKESAFLDHARTICRRAEREVLVLKESGAEVNSEIVRYLNRLSDLCWLWARWVETRAEQGV